MAFERLKARIKENHENRQKPDYVETYITTIVYLPGDATDAEIGEAGRWVVANYEALNEDGGYGALQPAGVYVGTDWQPGGMAAAKG